MDDPSIKNVIRIKERYSFWFRKYVNVCNIGDCGTIILLPLIQEAGYCETELVFVSYTLASVLN